MAFSPTTVTITPAFLHYAETMDAEGVVVDVMTAPFVPAGTVKVNPSGSTYRVLVPPGFKRGKATYAQIAVAAYRFGKRPVVTIEDEVAALRALILRARAGARGDCPFCGFDPCVDTCAVVRIRAGAWIAR